MPATGTRSAPTNAACSKMIVGLDGAAQCWATMIDVVARAVNRIASATGVDSDAAVTTGHRPECINDANWAWREASSVAVRDRWTDQKS